LRGRPDLWVADLCASPLHSREQYTSDWPYRVKRTPPSTIPHLSQISRAITPCFAKSLSLCGMASSTAIPFARASHFLTNVWAGATPAVFSPRASGEKWGRSSPFRRFACVQNQPSRETQPPCSVQLPFTPEVNGTGTAWSTVSFMHRSSFRSSKDD